MRAFPLLIAAFAFAMALPAFAQNKDRATTDAQINYAGFQRLTGEVAPLRAQRLISLEAFQSMAREPDTIVLDARSADAYAAGHIAGAVNLPFTDFTDASLREALGDPGVRILIYCNNNFSNNAAPVILKRVEVALNIQTFINLYGYGYRNVYELGEVIDFNAPDVGWVRG